GTMRQIRLTLAFVPRFCHFSPRGFQRMNVHQNISSEHAHRADRPVHVLMIYPLFNALSFWNYQAACEFVGAKYPTAPLGLITVAAMLPPHWDVRLVNRNTEELTEADFDWADMVMAGGMLVQQPDTLRLIEMCRQR